MIDACVDILVNVLKVANQKTTELGYWQFDEWNDDMFFVSFNFFPGPYTSHPEGAHCMVDTLQGPGYNINDVFRRLKPGVKFSSDLRRRTLTVSLGDHSHVIDMTPFHISDSFQELCWSYCEYINKPYNDLYGDHSWIKVPKRSDFEFVEVGQWMPPKLDPDYVPTKPTYELADLTKLIDEMDELLAEMIKKLGVEWKVVGYRKDGDRHKRCLEFEFPSDFGSGTLGCSVEDGLYPYIRGTLTCGYPLGHAVDRKYQHNWGLVGYDVYNLEIVGMVDAMDDLIPKLAEIDQLYREITATMSSS